MPSKPEKRILELWDYFQITSWLIQEKLWTEQDERFVWGYILSLNACQGNGSYGCIWDEDTELNLLEGNKVEPKQKRYHDLIKILFDAIGEDDFFTYFLFSW